MPWSDINDSAAHDAMVYNAWSVTPQVFTYFASGDRNTDARDTGSGELLSEHRLHALRHGRAKLQWRLCNPFKDERLSRSLLPLCMYVTMVVVALSCATAAACLWTSHAATPSPPLAGEGVLPLSCSGIRRTSRELKILLLSIDAPLFTCVGEGYFFAMMNIFALTPRPDKCPVVWMFVALGAALALAGSIIVAIREPAEVWGAKGSIGFAGIWVVVENATGIGALVMAICSGGLERRIVRSRVSAVRFGVVLLSSASALQATFYLVQYFSSTGCHPVFALACLFFATSVVLSAIKLTIRQWLKVPPLACTFMLFWFQAGAYASFRLILQVEENIDMVVVVALAMAVAEVLLRTGMVITAKFFYNYYVGKGDAIMALRVLDLHVATLLVDIVAEWAAIAIAGTLSSTVDAAIFEGLHTVHSPRNFVSTVALQVCIEALGDVASLIIAFAILPVSLEGIFAARGYYLLHTSCMFVSLVFIFTTLNLRVRIDCFSD